MSYIKLLTWNINRGGGKRINQIAYSIKNHKPDIVVLTEFRNNKSGHKLCSYLNRYGLIYQVSSKTPKTIDGLLVSSNIPFIYTNHGINDFSLQTRLICLDFHKFDLIAVYLNPYYPKKRFYQKKKEFDFFWEVIIKLAKDRIKNSSILIGDFNTGKHYLDEEKATFFCSDYINELERLEFVDAWRLSHQNIREYSYYSYRGNGFRIDHLYLSPKMRNSILSVQYSHLEREKKISDHSILIGTLKI